MHFAVIVQHKISHKGVVCCREIHKNVWKDIQINSSESCSLFAINVNTIPLLGFSFLLRKTFIHCVYDYYKNDKMQFSKITQKDPW